MAVNTKSIKRRMKSIVNTKKITKAMEMVSAAKMRRSVDGALKTRPYALLAKELMENLSTVEQAEIPLLEVRSVKNILVIMITSNRGLCGSFNSNMFKKMVKVLSDKQNISVHRIPGKEVVLPVENISIDLLGIGKKSALFAKKFNYSIIGVFDELKEKPSFEEILPISKLAINSFIEKKYDKVLIAYTDYKSSLIQEPKIRQVLPISIIDIEKMQSELGDETNNNQKNNSFVYDEFSCVFEPNMKEILINVLPRLVEVQIYQAVLESSASEHSARMVAMKNASEAAGEMLSELQLTYNKARQAAITQEISEIVGGAAALE